MLENAKYWKDGREFNEDVHNRFEFKEVAFIETSMSGDFFEVNLNNGDMFWYRTSKCILFVNGAILIK